MAALTLGLHEKYHLDIEVVVFYGSGEFEGELRENGIKVHSLNKTGRWDVISFLKNLITLIRREKPDIVHGYLDTPNVVLALFKPFLGGPKLVWGVRSAFMDWEQYDWMARITHAMSRILASKCDLIIANSRSGCEHLKKNGYPDEKIRLIPNGIDVRKFTVDNLARTSKRKEWGVNGTDFVIGIVARLDPMKDYETFLQAAAIFRNRISGCRFVCIGSGREDYARHLHAMAEQLRLSQHIVWIPSSHDVHALFNAFDCFTLSSYGEAFPNVLGEAMACSVPCVVTDVGDSAWLLGDVGIVVPAKDPQSLSEAWSEIYRMEDEERSEMGKLARQRVKDSFGTGRLIDTTYDVLNALVCVK